LSGKKEISNATPAWKGKLAIKRKREEEWRKGNGAERKEISLPGKRRKVGKQDLAFVLRRREEGPFPRSNPSIKEGRGTPVRRECQRETS